MAAAGVSVRNWYRRGGGPGVEHAPTIIAAASVRRVAAVAEKRIDPLVGQARGALASTSKAMDRVGTAAADVSETANALEDTSKEFKAVLGPDSPLVRDVRGAAEQLSQTAANLRRATQEDSGLLHSTERAMQDVSKAARALRELAELLERHPGALLRGRAQPEPAPNNPEAR